MRTSLVLSISWFVGLLAACSGSEGTPPPQPCGPNGECPQGYACVTEASGKFCLISIDAGSGNDACPVGMDAGPAPTTHISKHPDQATNSTMATFEFTATPSG